MTTRRQLGSGPATTTRSTPPTESAPRLLPAERGEPDALLAARADPEQAALQKGRRALGSGSESTEDGSKD